MGGVTVKDVSKTYLTEPTESASYQRLDEKFLSDELVSKTAWSKAS